MIRRNSLTRRRGHFLGVFLKEIKAFTKFALGNIFSREFMTVLIPLLIVWEAVPRLGLVPEALVPAPSVVAVAFWDVFTNLNMAEHIGASMLRFGAGLLLAAAVALPLGVLMGWNSFIRSHTLPLFQLLAPVPPPAWVPITIILLGIGLPMQVFLIFLGAFYPILFNTYQGIKETDPRYLASARVFGASEFTLLTKVYIWNALGSVVMGLKIGIATGLVMMVISEMYGGRSGIGFLLLEAKEFFQIDRMVVCMMLLGFIGWFLIEVMKYVESKLALWRIGR
ncbi:MAG: ABC transporter permease [Actinobacteria bacterium]|nr:ABC transporter permease [Actinomycetota bacterium]